MIKETYEREGVRLLEHRQKRTQRQRFSTVSL
ncbi:hypothetical protein GGP66_000200 [Salinibacter ruber]|nr:hypothetical protein [Salinibacter ruber]